MAKFSQGDQFEITFERGNNQDPIARVNGRVAFPQRGGKLPKVGETWNVELGGMNPKGTVYFLKLLEKIDVAARQAAEEAKRHEAEAARQQKHAADLAVLTAKLPELRAQIEALLPVPGGWSKEFEGGFTALLTNRYTSDATLDLVDGATFVCQFTITVRFGESQESIRFEPNLFVAGWNESNVKLCESPYYHTADAASGVLQVKFYVENKEFRLPYPATAKPPRREGKKVVQDVVAQTPMGEACDELRLYENPDSHKPAGQFEAVWGEFDFLALKAEVDTAAFQAAGIGDQMPEVKFEVGNFVSSYTPGSHGRDPDEGYWSTGPQETHDGGVTLTVDSPFLGRLAKENAQGVIFSFEGFLDRHVLEEKLKKEISHAAKMWNLTASAGEFYGEKLLVHLLAQIPEFKTMESLWAVETEGLKRGQMDGVPFGWTVIEGAGKISDSLTEKTRAVKVVTQATAQKVGLPGKALAGPVTVYWPEGQKDEISVTTTEEVRPHDPPFPIGQVFKAQITTLGMERPLYGLDHWNYRLRTQVPADVIRVTKWFERGEEKKTEEKIRETVVEKVWNANTYPEVKADAAVELFGEFDVVMEKHRKKELTWFMIRTASVSSESLAAMQGKFARDEAKMNVLWAFIVEKTKSEDERIYRFEFAGEEFGIMRGSSFDGPERAGVVKGYSHMNNVVHKMLWYYEGLQPAWAKSLGWEE